MLSNSSKVRKVLIVLFLVLGLLLPFLFNACANNIEFNQNTYMEANKYDLDIIIDNYGDMHVVEKIVIDNYTDKYNNYFYKEIMYNKNNMFGNSSLNKSELVNDARLLVEDYTGIVYDSKTSKDMYPYHFAGFSYNGDKDERGYRLRCERGNLYCDTIFYYNNPGFSTITTFTYEYTIKGVITQYNDISELNWVLLDYQPFTINNVNINVTLPSGNYDIKDEKTFFHGSGSAIRKFVDTNKINISTKKLSTDEQIEVRLLLGNEIFDSVRDANKVNINAVDDILKFELDQEKQANNLYWITRIATILIILIYIVIMSIVIIICYKKYDKEYVSEFYNEYYRELPASYSPAVMGYLYKFREIDDNDLTATLLDLIRRKYLLLDTNGSSSEEKDPNYIIMLNKEKSQNDLTDSEKYLIRWFIKEIGDGEKVTSLQLNSYCKSYSGAKQYQYSSQTWYKQIKSEARKYNFFDNDNSNFKSTYITLGTIISIIAMVCLGIVAFICKYFLAGCLIVGVACLLVSYIIYVNSINRRSKQGNEDFVRWRAFKKFLEDFSSFEDYPVPSLIIWEHYLVYATSFGIAEKVMDQLKLKFNLEQISSAESNFVVYFGLEHRISRTVRSMRTYSHATVARHNAQNSSSSFGGRSGGGFSGGSSFGGGGGSFGGGRR